MKRTRVDAPDEHQATFGYGDVWTWTALCADTKLVPSWLVGERTVWTLRLSCATCVPAGPSGAVDHRRPQALPAGRGDCFRLGYRLRHAAQNLRGSDRRGYERRYSPAVCTGTDVRPITGEPDLGKASTSYVERQNLTMRMGMRRFTRLTNGFSKKVENLAHAVSLHYMHYNFARPHKTLTKASGGYPTTPAMAAGVADQVWTLTEIAAVLD